MLDRKTIEKLGGWEGYRVERIAWPEGESRTVTIYLKPSARMMYCEQCGIQPEYPRRREYGDMAQHERHANTAWRLKISVASYRAMLGGFRQMVWREFQ